jgi:hypothetical protein
MGWRAQLLHANLQVANVSDVDQLALSAVVAATSSSFQH